MLPRVAACLSDGNPANDTWPVNGCTEPDKDLGFEIHLGFSFKLMNGLSFATAFGYMFIGDAYKSLTDCMVVNRNANGPGDVVQNGEGIQAVWEDADDSYIWFNSLTFAF